MCCRRQSNKHIFWTVKAFGGRGLVPSAVAAGLMAAAVLGTVLYLRRRGGLRAVLMNVLTKFGLAAVYLTVESLDILSDTLTWAFVVVVSHDDPVYFGVQIPYTVCFVVALLASAYALRFRVRDARRQWHATVAAGLGEDPVLSESGDGAAALKVASARRDLQRERRELERQQEEIKVSLTVLVCEDLPMLALNVYLLLRPAGQEECAEAVSPIVFLSTVLNSTMLGVKAPKLVKLPEVWTRTAEVDRALKEQDEILAEVRETRRRGSVSQTKLDAVSEALREKDSIIADLKSNIAKLKGE